MNMGQNYQFFNLLIQYFNVWSKMISTKFLSFVKNLCNLNLIFNPRRQSSQRALREFFFLIALADKWQLCKRRRMFFGNNFFLHHFYSVCFMAVFRTYWEIPCWCLVPLNSPGRAAAYRRAPQCGTRRLAERMHPRPTKAGRRLIRRRSPGGAVEDF